MARSKRPKLFENKQSIKNRMKLLGDALVNGTLNAGVEVANKEQPKGIEIKRKPKYLEMTEKRMNKMGVIDLKPYFAHSPNRIRKEDGGWYIRIPIRKKARDMSSRLYNQLRAVDVSPGTQKTVVSDYLYDRRRESDATMLNYEPVSQNITKQKSGNNRHTYVSFRTVSDKSPASSWIINRDKVNKDDTSKTFIRNVNRLMKWKMKNGFK